MANKKRAQQACRRRARRRVRSARQLSPCHLNSRCKLPVALFRACCARAPWRARRPPWSSARAPASASASRRAPRRRAPHRSSSRTDRRPCPPFELDFAKSIPLCQARAGDNQQSVSQGTTVARSVFATSRPRHAVACGPMWSATALPSGTFRSASIGRSAYRLAGAARRGKAIARHSSLTPAESLVHATGLHVARHIRATLVRRPGLSLRNTPAPARGRRRAVRRASGTPKNDGGSSTSAQRSAEQARVRESVRDGAETSAGTGGSRGLEGAGAGAGGGAGGAGDNVVSSRVASVAAATAKAETRAMNMVGIESRSAFRVVLGLAAGGVVVGTVVYWDNFKGWTSEQTAEVATKTIKDENVQRTAQELAKSIVDDVLTDEKVYHRASSFLGSVVTSDDTKALLVGVVKATLRDPATLAEVQQLANHVAVDLLKTPATRDQVIALLKQTLADPSSREAFVELLHYAAAQPAVRSALRDMGNAVLEDPAFRATARDSLTEVVHSVLGDPAVKAHATSFFKGVLGDEALQQMGGDALWSAVSYAFTPSWSQEREAREKEEARLTKQARRAAANRRQAPDGGDGRDVSGVEAEIATPALVATKRKALPREVVLNTTTPQLTEEEKRKHLRVVAEIQQARRAMEHAEATLAKRSQTSEAQQPAADASAATEATAPDEAGPASPTEVMSPAPDGEV